MTEHSDATLLTRFRAGDGAALDALLTRYETPLYQFLLGMLRDHHRAEDALQETFVRALERLDGVSPDHLRGWLFTVAYHQAQLSRRKGRGRAAAAAVGDLLEVMSAGPGPGESAERADDARRLRRLLGLLPAAQQEVIRQRVYEGKPFRDIAVALGCPLNTALSRMHEGLKRLRSLWERGHA
jgi:RNA polymerase sigma-70 factor (ECF subfamily)